MAQISNLKINEMTFGQIVVYFIYLFVMVAVGILTFRFFFLLFGANATSPVVEWVYATSYTIMAPFRGIFEIRQIGEGGSYFDFAGLFGILAYSLLGYWLAYYVKDFEVKKGK